MITISVCRLVTLANDVHVIYKLNHNLLTARLLTQETIMLVLLVLVAAAVLPSQADSNVENTLGRMQSQMDRLEVWNSMA